MQAASTSSILSYTIRDKKLYSLNKFMYNYRVTSVTRTKIYSNDR